jgi:hypothetical protein
MRYPPYAKCHGLDMAVIRLTLSKFQKLLKETESQHE